MAVTSLPASVPAPEVLAAYRLCWQIELAFKRLKGLLGCNRLPAKGEALARSRLLAHSVFALLIDAAAQDLLAVPPSTPLQRPGASSARKAGWRREVKALGDDMVWAVLHVCVAPVPHR